MANIKDSIYHLMYDAYCFAFSDRMILNVKSMKTDYNKVNLHYWDSNIVNGGEFPNNLGDDLSRIIVDYMLQREGLSLEDKIHAHIKHLYAVGSIINMGYQNATIWGSGFLEDLSAKDKFMHHRPMRKLDIRCVRGPKSRDNLLQLGYKCPEVYGDPALLMPLLFTPAVEVFQDYIIIPHFRKEQEYREKYSEKSIQTMVTNDYVKVISRMCSSKKVISSSLHGIILAETFNVPAVWLRDRDGIKDFKYYDYYYSTQRFKVQYARNIEDAIEMEPMPLPKNLDELRDGLIGAFPYDLWDKRS